MVLSSLPPRVISSGHCLWSKSGGEPAPPLAEVSTTAWGEWIKRLSARRRNRLYLVLLHEVGGCFAADKEFPLQFAPSSLEELGAALPSLWLVLMDDFPSFSTVMDGSTPLDGLGYVSPPADSEGSGLGAAASAAGALIVDLSGGSSPSLAELELVLMLWRSRSLWLTRNTILG